jgi:hypothetical protein
MLVIARIHISADYGYAPKRSPIGNRECEKRLLDTPQQHGRGASRTRKRFQKGVGQSENDLGAFLGQR